MDRGSGIAGERIKWICTYTTELSTESVQSGKNFQGIAYTQEYSGIQAGKATGDVARETERFLLDYILTNQP